MAKKVRVYKARTTRRQDLTLLLVLVLGGAAAVGVALYAVNVAKQEGEG